MVRFKSVLVNLYVKFVKLKHYRKHRNGSLTLLETPKILIIYRISDAGYKKEKPEYINNENCLANAVKCFPLSDFEWLVIADKCGETTSQMIQKYIPKEKVQNVSVGHGAGTFNIAMDFALKHEDNCVIYFLENDYIHTPNASMVLVDAFKFFPNNYITLYDHPDKYIKGRDKTKLYISNLWHWKATHSTTMTFAAKVKTLKNDQKTIRAWTTSKHPYDFQMFLELKLNGRKLLSAVPGCSTHGECQWLSPIINWEEIYLTQKQ